MHAGHGEARARVRLHRGRRGSRGSPHCLVFSPATAPPLHADRRRRPTGAGELVAAPSPIFFSSLYFFSGAIWFSCSLGRRRRKVWRRCIILNLQNLSGNQPISWIIMVCFFIWYIYNDIGQINPNKYEGDYFCKKLPRQKLAMLAVTPWDFQI